MLFTCCIYGTHFKVSIGYSCRIVGECILALFICIGFFNYGIIATKALGVQAKSYIVGRNAIIHVNKAPNVTIKSIKFCKLFIKGYGGWLINQAGCRKLF